MITWILLTHIILTNVYKIIHSITLLGWWSGKCSRWLSKKHQSFHNFNKIFLHNCHIPIISLLLACMRDGSGEGGSVCPTNTTPMGYHLCMQELDIVSHCELARRIIAHIHPHSLKWSIGCNLCSKRCAYFYKYTIHFQNTPPFEKYVILSRSMLNQCNLFMYIHLSRPMIICTPQFMYSIFWCTCIWYISMSNQYDEWAIAISQIGVYSINLDMSSYCLALIHLMKILDGKIISGWLFSHFVH